MPGMRQRRSLVLAIVLPCAVFAGGLADEAAAQRRPESEMHRALYVMLSTVWFDSGEASGRLISGPRCLSRSTRQAAQ